MNRSEILDKAKEIVTKDRQATHGNAEDNFELIRKFWGAYLGIDLSREDVAIMQILLKIARAKSNPKHIDNWVDICGYGACGGEIATNISNIEMDKDLIVFMDDNKKPVLYQCADGVFSPDEYQKHLQSKATESAVSDIKPGGSTDE